MSQAVHVFVGPTLPPGERPNIPEVVFHPPAAQGDLYALVPQRPLALALIDGYFERVPSVWHKEILWALSQGVRVFGAASMGALRAAELADYGMIGVGSIFEDFASGRLCDDDEVTIVHADASFDFKAGSEAMVNIRATLALAERQGVVSAGEHCLLVERVKRLFYPDRSFAALLACAHEELSSPSGERFAAWLREPAHRVNQKKLDALALLDRLAEPRADGPASEPVPWAFQHTDAWEQVRLALVARQAIGRDGPVEPAGLLATLGLTNAERGGWLERARLRGLEIAAARRDGFQATRDDVQHAIAEFCRDRGFKSEEQLRAWLASARIADAVFEALMVEQACVARSRLVPEYDLGRSLADLLCLEGRTPPSSAAIAAE